MTLVVDEGGHGDLEYAGRVGHAGAGGGQTYDCVCDDAEDVDVPGGVAGGRLCVQRGQGGGRADPGVRDSGQGRG